MNYLIREINENDWAGYWLFCFENRGHFESFPSILEGTEDWGADNYWELIFQWSKRVRDKTFIMEHDGKIIGMVRILMPRVSTPSIMIAMHHEFRNIGLGKQFLKHVLRKYFIEWNRSILAIQIDETNIPSRRLFESFGASLRSVHVYREGSVFEGKRYFLYTMTNPWASKPSISARESVT